MFHFVVDLPVRLPATTMEMSPPAAWSMGPIVFVLCEFQIVDQGTEQRNERGDASHELYKDRQRQAVKRRLKIGVRALKSPVQTKSISSTPPKRRP